MSSKNTHGISTARQNQTHQNRDRRQRQQQQHNNSNNASSNANNNNNNNNSNNNLNNNHYQYPTTNPSDSFDQPSSPTQALASSRDQQRTLATRQQSQHQHHPHTKAPVIVRQPSIFATFSRNLRSFLPLSSTALPPVVTGADAGGTNIGIGLGGRRRPISLGSPRAINASPEYAVINPSDEESITSVQWCDVEDIDGDSYVSGVQIWDTSNLSSVREVLNLRNGCLHIQGRVLHATILPTPSTSDDIVDEFALARPLVGILTSSQFTVYSLSSQSVIRQTSLKDATQFSARSNFIVITSIHPSTLHILSSSSLALLHTIHLPSSIYPSIALSLRLLAYTSPPPPHLHLYNARNAHAKQTFISRESQRREQGERRHVSSNSLRDTIGTSMVRVGGEVWSGVKALAAVSPIYIGGKSGDTLGRSSGPIGNIAGVTDDTHRGYSKSAPVETLSASLASAIDPDLPPSTATGANWITVLDLKPLFSGGSPRIVSRFAPFSSESSNRGDISHLWFGAGSKSGAIPMLCVAPRDGQRVAIFQIRIHRPVSLSIEGNEGADEDAKLEMPLHWYDLRRGLTSATVENVVWDKAGKWVGVCTAKRTIHVFAPNPYGGPTDRLTHLSAKVSNAEQMQPLSTELSPLVRLRPFDIPTHTANLSSNGIFEAVSNTVPLAYVFIPSNISSTLPSLLLPQSSSTSHSSSPATSFPLLSSPSPQLHAAMPQKPFQDILVFNPAAGEMSLYRIILDWSIHGAPGSMDQSVSPSVASRGYNTGYSFSLPVADLNSGDTRRMAVPNFPSLMADSREESTLVGKESVLATWNLKRGRDWSEVKGVPLSETCSVMIGKKKDFSDFIAQAELSPFSLSPGVLPKSIYLSHQFSFYMFSTWDYHALLDSHQLNSVIGEEIVFRRDVEISGIGDGKDNTENAEEEMIFGFGDAVDLQGGSDIKSVGSTTFRRNSNGARTFDVPIATAIHSELDYSSQSPPTIPMFPNGVPAATGVGGRSPSSRILDHSIPPPLRRGAVAAGAVAAEGFGRIRREVGSLMRSPVLRPARAGANERRRSIGGTSVTTTSSSLSVSPSPGILEPMPLEFDETDEVFLEDDVEVIAQTEGKTNEANDGGVSDTLKVVESEVASTSGSVSVGPGSGASATASVSTPRTQPDEVLLEVPFGWPDSHEGDEAWDDEARATVAEAEMFDEISVAGFMDEDMGRYERKK